MKRNKIISLLLSGLLIVSTGVTPVMAEDSLSASASETELSSDADDEIMYVDDETESELILEEESDLIETEAVTADEAVKVELTESRQDLHAMLTEETNIYAPVKNMQTLYDPTESADYVRENIPDTEKYMHEVLIDPSNDSISVNGQTLTKEDISVKLSSDDEIDTMEEREAVLLAVAEEADTAEDVSSILYDSAYETETAEDGKISVKAPYQLQSLIVYAEELPYSYGSANGVFNPDYDMYLLIYNNEADAKNGYEALQADGYEVYTNNNDGHFDDAKEIEIIPVEEKANAPVETAEMDTAGEGSELNYTFWESVGVTHSSVKRFSHIGTAQRYSESYGRSVKVGIVDSGMEYYALSGNFSSKIDHVYSFCGGSAYYDTVGHGTNVASVVLTNTSRNVHVSSYRFAMTSTNLNNTWAIYAIQQAIYDGMDIVNMSFGFSPYNVFGNIFEKGAKQGVTFVASAGNTGNQTTQYPASCGNVLSVSGITTKNKLDTRSSYGPRTDFTSYFTMPAINTSRQIVLVSGTSFSSPLTCACLADIMGIKNVTSKKSVSLAKRLVLDLGSTGKDSRYGYGLINLKNPYSFSVSSKARYTGSSVYPTVKIKNIFGSVTKTLKKNSKASNYTIRYSNNVKVGKGSVTAKFGMVKLKKTFSVVPNKTYITTAVRSNRIAGSPAASVTINYKKRTPAQCSGYQVQLATDSAFSNILSTKTMKGYTKTSVKYGSSLSYNGNTYYLRFRTYKVVNSKKYYSVWKSYRLQNYSSNSYLYEM